MSLTLNKDRLTFRNSQWIGGCEDCIPESKFYISRKGSGWRNHSIKDSRFHKWVNERNPKRNLGQKPVFATSPDDQFIQLAANWKNETKGLSQIASKINNKNYFTIIGMGVSNPDRITKLILQDLQKGNSYWHYALKKITNANPVPKGLATNIEQTSKFWLQWGTENNKI